MLTFFNYLHLLIGCCFCLWFLIYIFPLTSVSVAVIAFFPEEDGFELEMSICWYFCYVLKRRRGNSLAGISQSCWRSVRNSALSCRCFRTVIVYWTRVCSVTLYISTFINIYCDGPGMVLVNLVEDLNVYCKFFHSIPRFNIVMMNNNVSLFWMPIFF